MLYEPEHVICGVQYIPPASQIDMSKVFHCIRRKGEVLASLNFHFGVVQHDPSKVVPLSHPLRQHGELKQDMVRIYKRRISAQVAHLWDFDVFEFRSRAEHIFILQHICDMIIMTLNLHFVYYQHKQVDFNLPGYRFTVKGIKRWAKQEFEGGQFQVSIHEFLNKLWFPQ